MFEFCLRWFAWGFDASLKAALIAIIAAAVLKLLRIKDSNICHRVWTGVLSGMLLLPVLSPLMPALRLPLMPSPEWLIAWSDQPVVISPDAAPILSSPAADLASPIEPQAAQPIIAPNNRSFRPTDFPPARFSSAAPIPPPNFANPELLPPETQTAAQSPTLPTVPVPAVRPPFISRRALAAVLVFLTGGIWLAIAAALTLRLALALWIAARLRRSSIAIESTALSRENTIATVRECPVIRVPLTVGLLQPHILLPPDWRNWSSEKLHAVLAHEQMHAQRADCLVALLAELNCCFYWFHPLAWCLKQQLSSLAEQACDDAAILVLGSSVLGSSASTGDRARYARHLLEVAAAVSRHKSRLAPLGVSMARRSNVETRILAILDFTRPLSQRLTWSKALALLTVMVPLIALAAALQPSTGEQSKPTKTPSENAEAINEKEAATKQADVAAPKSPLTITGSILNAQGQPVPDANIHIVPQFAWRESSKKRTPRLVTKTDNAGRFEFTPEDNEAAKPTTDRLLITAPRYGTEFLPLREVLEQGQLTISLADDKPIRGRILTLEGQPVTDAKITVNRIQSLKSGDLKPYIDIVKAGNGSNFSFDDSLYEPPHIDPITTNAEGRFEVAGIGPNRVAELKVVSRTIQHALLTVMTVESEPLKPREGRGFSDLEKNRPPVFGATFDWVAKPARIITGTVVDAKTHQPITGAGISSLSEGHAKTDENGRFELLGCAKAKSYGLLLNGDNTQYIGGSARVADTPGFEPIEVTLELTRGTTVKGRVIDQATQQPIDHARLTYFPLVPNERVVPGIGSTQANAWGAFTETYCNADGEFSIAALPGPGFIGVSAPKHAAYQPAVVDAIAFFKREGIPYGRDPQPKGFPKNSLMVAGSNGGMSSTPAGQYNFVELLNAPDQPELTLAHDIALVAAQNLAGTVLGPSGQPLTGTTVWGLANDYLHDSQTLRTSAFTVARLGPDETRTLIFRHDAQKLATQLKVTAESPRPQRVTLQPWGEISGRLLDSDGTPLVNLELQPGGELQEGEILGRLPGHVATDDQGRFHLTGLVPGLVYSLTAHRVATPPQIRIRLKPGEILDLGDIKEAHEHLSLNASLPPGEDSPTLTRSVSEGRGVGVSPAMSPPLPLGEGRGEGLKDAAVVSVTGIVLLPTNQPATNTHVAVVADPNKPRQGGDLSRNFEILAEGTTDVAGRFQLQLKGVSSTSHKYANLIARQDGSGIAWQNLNLDMPEVTAKLKLEAEEPIRGRLIDLEGQPASNISLRIRSVMKRTTAEWSQEGIGFDSETLPAAWLAPLTTDQDGRFVIHGISSAHGVALNVAGSDRFAPQDILLNTGMAEERNERDGTYRSLVRNAKPGEEIVLPLSPSQLFEGTIRYDDTQEPVPHARITIWASQQKNGGSMTSVEGQTDATGRYRIAPRPGIRFGVKAYPPNGAAYLVRETTDDIRWESGDRIKQVDLTLPAGILIHGKILTAGSKEPVAGASLQFIPQFTSQSSASQPLPKGIVTGWQGIQVSDSKGDFQIAVPNHPGHLLVNHDTGNFILHEIGSAFLNRGQPGGQRNYAHAIQKIDPANLSSHHAPRDEPKSSRLAPRDEPKSSRLAPRDEPAEVLKSLNLTIELQPGAIASGRIVDPQGQPIASGIVVSRLHIWSHWLTWHGNNGQTGPIVDGRFELKGLQEGVEYPTHFLDPKRRLGATVLLSSHHAPRDREGEAREGEAREGEAPAEPQQTIVLEPCGSATARFLDGKGQPLADIHPNFDIIITPGVHRYDFAAQQAGQLAADSDFIANVDRLNHGVLKTDAQGKLTIPALIPGATYAVKTLDNRRWEYVKEFQVQSGQTLDLGDITQPPPSDQPKAASTTKEPGTTPTRSVSEASPPLLPPGEGRGEGLKTPALITISGLVLLPTGQPAPGATIRAAAPLWAMMKPFLGEDFQSPMSEVKADSAGRFSITFPTQPFGDVSKFDAQWQQIWKKTAIAASLQGYGPAWVEYEEVETRQQPLTLQLVEDLPIRGRVINLEGRPIAGTTVKIGEPQAAENEDLSAWLAGIKSGELPWTVGHKAPREIESRLAGTPTAATTDAEGAFEIRGIGRERAVGLTFESETVAHREAEAATRSMATLHRNIGRARENSPDTTEPVFGAEFTYTAEPARTVEGIVLDAKTRQPLAGVAVESDKLVNYPYSNYRVLKTTTDTDGRFRLIGLPKGVGNRLLLLPTDDQPYFMRRVEVPDPVGLGPAKIEIELHRGIWITGRVTDKQTGEPVEGVRLHYLPFRTNEFVQRLPEFDSNGNVDGDQMRYTTRRDGTFRLVGYQGRAIVGAESVIKHYRQGVGYDEIDAPKTNQQSDWLDTYRSPINPGSKWPNVMKEINPDADAAEFKVDLQLDPGLSVRIRVTDSAGNALTGASVAGLTFHGYFQTEPDAVVTAVNLGPQETRVVLLEKKDGELGRVLTIGPDEIRAGEALAQLLPCAKLTGQVLRDDGTPFSGLAIEPRVLPFGDFGRQLRSVATDAEGRFQATLLPGCKYNISGMGGSFQYVELANDLSVEPGQTLDLGTLKLDKKGKATSWKP